MEARVNARNELETISQLNHVACRSYVQQFNFNNEPRSGSRWNLGVSSSQQKAHERNLHAWQQQEQTVNTATITRNAELWFAVGARFQTVTFDHPLDARMNLPTLLALISTFVLSVFAQAGLPRFNRSWCDSFFFRLLLLFFPISMEKVFF